MKRAVKINYLKDSGCPGQRSMFLSSSGSTLRCSRSHQSRIWSWVYTCSFPYPSSCQCFPSIRLLYAYFSSSGLRKNSRDTAMRESISELSIPWSVTWSPGQNQGQELHQ